MTYLPPVIVFGGDDNALSIVRSLGRRGVPVYVLNKADADVHRSRFGTRIRLPGNKAFAVEAIDFLLGPKAEASCGAVLLGASDEALEQIFLNRDPLGARFKLDLSNPEAQQAMLDKLTTYEVAREAGVPTPRFWPVESTASLDALDGKLVFPLIVKPKLSHLFQARFNAKFFVAHNEAELREAMNVMDKEQIGALLVEFIPGPDSQLCSYYTYLDEQGEACFDFTKRIIRRHPVNMGLACYHITDHVPDVGELSCRLFRHAGLRGLANAEFKLDERDGQLKLIECNARFTAANGLVDRAGFDLASFVYDRLVGIDSPPLKTFTAGLRLWDPWRDLRAFRELNRRGDLSFGQWLRSVLHRQTFPSFTWSDPMPSLHRLWRRLGKGLGAKGGRLSTWLAAASLAAGLVCLALVPPSYSRYTSFGFDIERQQGGRILEQFYRVRWPGDGSFRVGRGLITFSIEEEHVDWIDLAGRFLDPPHTPLEPVSWRHFQLEKDVPERTLGRLERSSWLVMPSWFPATVLLAAPALYLLFRHRKKTQ
jgi:D-aspartate ligase